MSKETVECRCGKLFITSRYNGILRSKKCPQCMYAEAIGRATKKKSDPMQKSSGKKKVKSSPSPDKALDKRLDDAWSLAVKVRAGFKCEKCGKTTTLNSHHITTRRKRLTRWSLSNGICLCVAHHTFSSDFSAHQTPLLFIPWVTEYRGKNNMDLLASQARSHAKHTRFEKERMLDELNKFIKDNQ